MFLLITGASGVGKTTVRRALGNELEKDVVAVELADIVPIPAVPTLAWRQESLEKVVLRAVELQEKGRHLLFCGDPVPPGELLAVPSAPLLNSIAMCLLDVQPEVQRERLWSRGEDDVTLSHHLGFADWMREHCRNPQHAPSVITQHGWFQMRWERWKDWRLGDSRWNIEEIDTTHLSQENVKSKVLEWCWDALSSKSGVPNPVR